MIHYNHPFTDGGRKDTPIFFTQKDIESSVYPKDRLNSSNLVHMYLSAEDLTACIMEIAPGGTFDPPDCHPGDEVYYILEGAVLVLNPATGQSVEAKEGEAVLIPEGALHTGYNFHDSAVKALAVIAPKVIMDGGPPQAAKKLFTRESASMSADSSYEAKHRFGSIDDLGKWPFNASELRKNGVIINIDEDRKLKIIHGDRYPMLMKFSVSNDYLHVGEYVLAGSGSMAASHCEPLTHGGCSFLFGLESPMTVILPNYDKVYVLNRNEGLYLPPNTKYQLANYSKNIAKLAFAIAKTC